MEQWETRTCIQFVERTNERDYVEMTEDLRCKHTPFCAAWSCSYIH